MPRLSLIYVVAFSVSGALLGAPASGTARVPPRSRAPDGSFDFAYQQVASGKTADGVFVGRLVRSSGHCTLFTVNLLPRMPDGTSGKARPVSIDHRSTTEGTLKVTTARVTDGTVVTAEESVVFLRHRACRAHAPPKLLLSATAVCPRVIS